MRKHLKFVVFVLSILLINKVSAQQNSKFQTLHGHVPTAIGKLGLQSIGRLDSKLQMNLAISLPMRNKETLTNLLKQLYDPTNPNYHHWLTSEQRVIIKLSLNLLKQMV
jgi:subtilase family serine protease